MMTLSLFDTSRLHLTHQARDVSNVAHLQPGNDCTTASMEGRPAAPRIQKHHGSYAANESLVQNQDDVPE